MSEPTDNSEPLDTNIPHQQARSENALRLQSSEAGLASLSDQQSTTHIFPHYPLPSTVAHTTPHLPLHPQRHHQTRPTHLPTTTPTPNPRHARLHTQIRNLTAQIQQTQSALTTALSELQNTSSLPSPTTTTATTPPKSTDVLVDTDGPTLQHARALVKDHIRLLKRYNAIKDIGLGLMGLIADRDGRRVAEVMDELGVGEDD